MANKILVKGIAANGGTAQGRARLFFSGDDSSSFEDGDILVTTLTDPTMVNAMIKAAAIVTDIGGITSHPAILSREMGIPCVVSAKDATKKVENGMELIVDGDKGEVYEVD